MILSNPDMLHVGVLPHHDRWGDVLANLRFVVVDEAHVYRGVFGSHVGERAAAAAAARADLRRRAAVPARLGDDLEPGRARRASCSALPVTVIGDDAAPRAERTVVLWNPPLLDEELGLRGSPLAEAAKLQAGLVERGLRTLTFAKSRKAAELIHRFTAERLGDDSQLSPYRAGYTAGQRREIERRLGEGDLLGVSATNALELGIDVGLLDAVISVGFPGTVASLRQQWGRAGRRGHGLAVLVAGEDALDQYFMREPDKLLGRRVEAALLDHANPRDPRRARARGGVRGAARRRATPTILGPEALAAAAARPGAAAHAARASSGPASDYPARARRRCARPSRTRSRSSTRRAAPCSASSSARARTRRCTRAPSTSTSASRTSCTSWTRPAMRAIVEPFRGDWYTQAKKETQTEIVRPLREERRLGLDLVFGEIEVTEQVVGYERKTIRSQERIELVPLELPPSSFATEAIWFVPEPGQLDGLDAMPKLLGTLHAAEHALIAMLPLWAMCDRWDIGGLSTNLHPQTGRPTVFVYDGHAGGVGITERGFEQFEGWVADTARMVAGCPCVDGCPSCVQSPKCGNLNDLLDKAGARTLLERLVAAARAS